MFAGEDRVPDTVIPFARPQEQADTRTRCGVKAFTVCEAEPSSIWALGPRAAGKTKLLRAIECKLCNTNVALCDAQMLDGKSWAALTGAQWVFIPYGRRWAHSSRNFIHRQTYNAMKAAWQHKFTDMFPTLDNWLFTLTRGAKEEEEKEGSPFWFMGVNVAKKTVAFGAMPSVEVSLVDQLRYRRAADKQVEAWAQCKWTPSSNNTRSVEVGVPSESEDEEKGVEGDRVDAPIDSEGEGASTMSDTDMPPVETAVLTVAMDAAGNHAARVRKALAAYGWDAPAATHTDVRTVVVRTNSLASFLVSTVMDTTAIL